MDFIFEGINFREFVNSFINELFKFYKEKFLLNVFFYVVFYYYDLGLMI